MSNDIIPIQEDNPCWGSPTQCDLKHLLSKFSKETTVVYETSQYVVLNKPPDLRMDGPYSATVHKLLNYWYPPPSLCDKEDLLESVSQFHQYNSIADNDIRPCHQLDYATSGLLCIARNQAAANHAIRQWEGRNVTKEYLAVVEGSLTFDSTTSSFSSLPRLSSNEIHSTLQHLEYNYKKLRRPNRKDDTFQGFQPASSLFQKYKSTLRAKPRKKKKRPRPEDLSEDQWDQIWKPVQEAIEETNKTNEESNKVHHDATKSIQEMNWRTVCRTRVSWKESFEKAAKIHNSLLREILQEGEECIDKDYSFPIVFGEVLEDTSEKSTNKNIIYISCPLAQDPKDFAMKVPHELLQDYPHMKPFVGNAELDYKPSLTKCTIVSYNDTMTTTKVKLLPLTGRRHQLRVHMALVSAGKGIMGDATYNPQTRENTSSRSTTERMCLHSHKLSLRLLVDEDKDEMVHLEACDPF